ncbi:OLC1v1021951C1 [Oldenlandia corymbosa var. corymbosa]|uniref:Pectinesterase n=1 Tax=Oldenlandia corymbosa var. corymbosa TaxID=529605 RepID=A0AAV1C0H6_OLDCO|nr:OLC1v1021951C1 [Oldenlandia corymbosa var. corymbosa]
MANMAYQSLLDTPSKKSNNVRFRYVVIGLAAILGTIAIFSVTVPFKTSLLSNDAVSSKAHLCNHAYDPSSCLAVLSEVSRHSPGLLQQSSDANLLGMVLAKSSYHIRETIEFAHHVTGRINDRTGQAALADCMQLMDLSMDRVIDSMVALASIQTGTNSHWDIHSWLSSVLTNHVTCLDGLTGAARSVMEPMVNEMVSRARASLAVFVAVKPQKEEEDAETLDKPLNGDLPSWITTRDRRLLQSSGQNINANSVVAQDGSGNYKTVQAAVDAAPNNSPSRYVIYIKKGTYKEQVSIGKNKKNLMLVGDGQDATIITGSLNVVDGSTTFNSATVAAVGDGFIAQDLRFQNTAGPEKHQAVALRVGADKSVINRCRIDAYQDTLYAHTLRQFYRDSYITGTVDFIFGDAAVVLQNCQLVARKPMNNQQNMVTAQGKADPNTNTGTSIQNCNIVPSSDLAPVKGSIKTFLGRPWKAYSKTVVMQSTISDHINPAGWAPWDGDFALKTLYYGEYLNRGPGAGTSQRVKWPGYRVITSAAEANKFTVAQLIQGGQWLKNTGVTYTEGL